MRFKDELWPKRDVGQLIFNKLNKPHDLMARLLRFTAAPVRNQTIYLT